ncbi:hypothetical protein [Nonomuraea sp. NPDC049695]|uniref:hypothetical protein n=1 Tax=Nonomuraea sp. NPDC049695 TaxID=3154734 RepID=UPI00341532B6
MVRSLLAAVAVRAWLTVVPGPGMTVPSSSAPSGDRTAGAVYLVLHGSGLRPAMEGR